MEVHFSSLVCVCICEFASFIFVHVCMYAHVNIWISICVHELCVYFYACTNLSICARAYLGVYIEKQKFSLCNPE